MSLHFVRISCDDTTGRLLQLLLVPPTPDRIVTDEDDQQARPSPARHPLLPGPPAVAAVTWPSAVPVGLQRGGNHPIAVGG